MKSLCRVLLLLGLLAAAPAVHATPADEGIRTGTLLVGNGTEPQDLDPHTVISFNEYNLLMSLFEGLAVPDEATARPMPGAASSWEISPDGLTYTFHLRPEGRWSNGEPVTAEDFVRSWQRALAPRLASEFAYLLHMIEGAEDYNAGRLTDFNQVGIKSLDTLTLQVRLSRPTPYFLDLCAHQITFPVHFPSVLSRGAFDQRGTGWTRPGQLIGNGAFRLTEWSPNQRIVVEANSHYWDHARNRLRRIEFFPNDDLAAEERNFRAGQLHVTYDLLPNKIASYREKDPEKLRVDPFLENFFVRFNVTRAPFDDRRVRQALARGIDREALCRTVLAGSRLPSGSFVPTGTGGYQSETAQPSDFTEARRLLAEAGYPGGEGLPTLEILFNQDGVNQRIFEALQEMWRRELGVKVRLTRTDFRVYLDSLRTLNFHAARSRWVADYNDPGNYLELMLSGGPNNWTGWSNAEYDRLVRAAGTAADPAERLRHLHAAEAILLDEAPVVPLFFGARTYLLDPRVKGWQAAPLGVRRFQHVWLEP